VRASSTFLTRANRFLRQASVSNAFITTRTLTWARSLTGHRASAGGEYHSRLSNNQEAKWNKINYWVEANSSSSMPTVA